MKTKIFILLLFSIFLTNAQTSKNIRPYQIDPSIETLVDNSITNQIKEFGKTLNYSFLEIEAIAGDSSKFNPKSERSYKTSCSVFGETNMDTLYIYGWDAGTGFRITLFKDSCVVNYCIDSDRKDFKINQSDIFTNRIVVPCDSYILKLNREPIFKKGKIIKGTIQLTSGYFYHEQDDGTISKSKEKLTCYFKAGPLSKKK